MLTISNNYQSIDDITNRSNNYIDWNNVVDYFNQEGAGILVPLIVSLVALIVLIIKSGMVSNWSSKREIATSTISLVCLVGIFISCFYAFVVAGPNKAAKINETIKAVENNISLKYNLNELRELKTTTPLNNDELSYTGMNYNKEENEAINLLINVNKSTGEPTIMTTELVDKKYVKSLERNK